MLIGAIMVLPTYFLFGPVGAFHHMYVFGVFWYMGWNGEDPLQLHLSWGVEAFEVGMNPWRLLLTMAVWGLIVVSGLILGSLPLFFGLAVIFPVLGHATWHFYRKAVSPDKVI